MPPAKAQGKRMSEAPGQSKKKVNTDTDSQNGMYMDKESHTFETLRDEASHFMHSSNYDHAIELYDQALEMKPADKVCLVSRSRCYLQMGNAKLALADAEKSMEEDKEFNRGIACKADALYLMGNFETALVFYHRGHKLRPEQQEFRLGIQKCQEAINNSIGSPDTVKLKTEGDLSFFWQAQQEEKQNKKKIGAGVGRYRKPGKGAEKKEKERPKSAGNEKTVKQLLGQLYADREFLEKIFKDEDNNNRNTKISQKIQKLALDGINYLDSRTDFWGQQKPMYSRKRDKDMRDARQGSGRSKSDAAKYVLKNLEEIDQAQSELRYEDSLKQSKKVLKNVEKWSDNDIPNRPEVIANLHSCIGNAQLEMGNQDKALEHHQKDLEIADKHDLADAKSRAMDNLGRVYARIGKFEEAIKIWNDKLPLSKSALESTWLLHEIGRCHLELTNNTEAKDFGEKSLAAAQEAEDVVWQLNASVLIAQAEVRTGDYQQALESFERSLDMAKAQGDQEAEKAIKKAIEDVNDKIVKGLKGDEQDDADKNKDNVDNDDADQDNTAADNKSYEADFEDDKEDDNAGKSDEQQDGGTTTDNDSKINEDDKKGSDKDDSSDKEDNKKSDSDDDKKNTKTQKKDDDAKSDSNDKDDINDETDDKKDDDEVKED